MSTSNIDSAIKSRQESIAAFDTFSDTLKLRVLDLLSETDLNNAVVVALDELNGTW